MYMKYMVRKATILLVLIVLIASVVGCSKDDGAKKLYVDAHEAYTDVKSVEFSLSLSDRSKGFQKELRTEGAFDENNTYMSIKMPKSSEGMPIDNFTFYIDNKNSILYFALPQELKSIIPVDYLKTDMNKVQKLSDSEAAGLQKASEEKEKIIRITKDYLNKNLPKKGWNITDENEYTKVMLTLDGQSFVKLYKGLVDAIYDNSKALQNEAKRANKTKEEYLEKIYSLFDDKVSEDSVFTHSIMFNKEDMIIYKSSWTITGDDVNMSFVLDLKEINQAEVKMPVFDESNTFDIMEMLGGKTDIINTIIQSIN